ncbi:uncharacterized protein LOC101853780 [Aplysia californica]|uniref:Uncharacterized protein LOC101853780 n=1 Tax=Aplysia californica TaxID=6500 RepID=A0ABM0JKU6_APLCA|nr:uncharacterized protein LOC101853780 [Aplysia californica]
MLLEPLSGPGTVMLSLCCLLLLLLLSPSEARLLRRPGQPVAEWPVLCPPRTFYSRKLEECRPCSSCPMNQIITSPCHGMHDTRCGPFYDLQHLVVSAAKDGDNKFVSQRVAHGRLGDGVGGDDGDDGNGSRRHHQKSKNHTGAERGNEAGSGEVKIKKTAGGGVVVSSSAEGFAESSKTSSRRMKGQNNDVIDNGGGDSDVLISDWKSLTLFTCVAIVFVVIVLVVGICCIRRKMLNMKKTYEYKAAPVEV